MRGRHAPLSEKLNAGHEIGQVEIRLRESTGHAVRHHALELMTVRDRRDHHDGDHLKSQIRADDLHERDAVHDRHAHIEHDDIGILAQQVSQRLLAIGKRAHTVSRPRQGSNKHFA